jgi:hypothetical protein
LYAPVLTSYSAFSSAGIEGYLYILYTTGTATADAAIPKSTVTAKGNLIVGTASATVTNVAVGTDNYVLTADSAQASGVKWAATYTAPTLGSTSIASGATVTTIAGLTLTSPAINTAILKSPREIVTVSATAATGTINFDANTQGTLYYTTNASANWTLNVRGSSSATLNSVMAVGDALTVTFLATQGSTAYYPTALTIDGTSVTPKYQAGVAFTTGNTSSIDAYTYSIVKTASATYTVFTSQTKFA